MHRLRNRLIIAFAAATLIPLAGTLWIATALLDRSLAYTATQELDALSKSLEQTAREFYQEARQNLKEDAAAGRRVAAQYMVTAKDRWPPRSRNSGKATIRKDSSFPAKPEIRSITLCGAMAVCPDTLAIWGRSACNNSRTNTATRVKPLPRRGTGTCVAVLRSLSSYLWSRYGCWP